MDEDINELLNEYEPLQEHLARTWAQRLIAGETGNSAHGIAESLMEDFYDAVALGEQPPQPTLEWIASVVKSVLENGKQDARKAFSLQPRKQGTSKYGDHLDIAFWIAITIRRGYREPQAINDAAAIFGAEGMDESSVRRVWRKFSKGEGWNFREDDRVSEYFELKGHPLPKPRKSRQ
jgi:hypothetical protein